MKKNILILFSALLSAGMCFAQDAHLSHYFNVPLFTNPALAGNGIQNMRIALDYRSQNTSGATFKTQTIGLDKIVNRVGFGILFSKNSAGKDGFSRLNILAGISYKLKFGDDGINQLTGGLQVGILQKSFNPDALTFENQYSYDGGYDPTAPTGETFANTKTTRPDVNAGLFYNYGQNKKDIKFKPFAGISFAHINKPKESFIEENNTNPIRMNVQLGTGIRMSEKVELKPMMLYMKQETFKELNVGMISEFALPNTNTIKAGLFYRSHDAVVVYGGYQINKIFAGISYDANASAYQGNSAFEISLVYTPQGKAPVKREKKPVQKTHPVEKKKLPEPKLKAPEFYSIAKPMPTPAFKQQTSKQEIIKPKATYTASTILPKGVKVEKYVPAPAVTEVIAPAPVAKVEAPKKEVVKTEPLDEFANHNFQRLDLVVFKAGTVKFDVNYQFDVVESAIDYMFKFTDSKILLTGNTSVEEQRSKADLGLKRAQSIKDYMVKKGISEYRIKVNNVKDTKPFSTEVDGQPVQQNSRVDIYLIK